MKIILDKNKLDDIDISNLQKYIEWSSQKNYFILNSGKEIYKLLAFLGKQFNNETFIQIGTSDGLDALALSLNENNKIISYDYQDVLPNTGDSIKTRDNIEIRVEDFMENAERFLKSSMIIINIHPHDGFEERVIIDYLLENNYSGLIILSNTKVTNEMKKLWDSITEVKYDITEYGFWGGTGIICPKGCIHDIIMQ
jgi:hypothetical protein